MVDFRKIIETRRQQAGFVVKRVDEGMDAFGYKGWVVSIGTRRDPTDWIVAVQRPPSPSLLLPLAHMSAEEARLYAKAWIDKQFKVAAIRRAG